LVVESSTSLYNFVKNGAGADGDADIDAFSIRQAVVTGSFLQ
jgi:hypothetical protein